MSNAIQQTHGISSQPQCGVCGETSGTKAFELTVGSIPQIMTWCPTHAREVAGVLSSSFPDELPQFVKTMQKL